MSDEVRAEVMKVLDQHFLCVMSTVSQASRPESAIVGFSSSNNLELLIGTSHKTRKYANIMENPYVAVVVGDTNAEIQYEGTAKPLTQDELNEHLKKHFKKLPGTKKYLEDPNQKWLLVSPNWIRLTVHETPNRIEELSLA